MSIKRIGLAVAAAMHRSSTQCNALTTARRRWPDRLDWPDRLYRGVSAEAFRIDALRRIPAAIRFINAEPLLNARPKPDLAGVHRRIAGGAPGPGARPCESDWIRDLPKQYIPTTAVTKWPPRFSG